MLAVLVNFYIFILLKIHGWDTVTSKNSVLDSKRYSDSGLLTNVQLYLQFSNVKLKSEAGRCILCLGGGVFL